MSTYYLSTASEGRIDIRRTDAGAFWIEIYEGAEPLQFVKAAISLQPESGSELESQLRIIAKALDGSLELDAAIGRAIMGDGND